MYESCHTNVWVMSHVSMSHVPCVNEICATCIHNSITQLKKKLFWSTIFFFLVNKFFFSLKYMRYVPLLHVCARTRLCWERKRERARNTCSTPLTNFPPKAHMCTCMYVYMYICVHISVCVRGRMCVLARARVCVCVCVCVCRGRARKGEGECERAREWATAPVYKW